MMHSNTDIMARKTYNFSQNSRKGIFLFSSQKISLHEKITIKILEIFQNSYTKNRETFYQYSSQYRCSADADASSQCCWAQIFF